MTFTTYTNRKTNVEYRVAMVENIDGKNVYKLVDSEGKEKKIAESTLKRNYKKVTVEMCNFVSMVAFTGMKLGQFKVVESDDDTITVLNKKGNKLVFDRKTGSQLNYTGNPKFANRILV